MGIRLCHSSNFDHDGNIYSFVCSSFEQKDYFSLLDTFVSCKGLMQRILLAITPSLGSYNLLGLFSVSSFSNRVNPELNLSEPTYAQFAQMLSHQTLLFLPPFPRRSS